MNHIALDIGGVKSQFCVRDDSGEILREGTVATHSIGGFLKRHKRSRVILETCAEAFAIADSAVELGHDVRIVPSSLAPSLGVGAHGIKTDRRDAQILSETSTQVALRSVHLRSRMARDRKSMVVTRGSLVTARTQLINCVRGWARGQLLRIPSGSPVSFPERIRKAAISQPDGLPSFIERLLDVIALTTAQIAEADAELTKLARNDPVCRLLMTAPGVGPMTALLFLSAVDDVSRFRSAHALESYLGLTPGERSSSARTRRTGITKAGPALYRWCVCQACWSAWRNYPKDPLSLWTDAVAKRRGRQVAIMAMARKLSGILFAMLRDGVPYQPRNVSIAKE